MNDEIPDITRSHHGGNPESEAANASIDDVKEIVRQQILRYANVQGKRGITADEVAVAWCCTHNHVAPRITELKAMGRLMVTEERRTTQSGRSARVLVLPKFAEEL